MTQKKNIFLHPLTITMAGTGLFWLGRKLWPPRWSLEGRVVLITGGSRGLGLAMAQEFARHGARLALCARDEQELARARTHLLDANTKILTIACDLTDRNQIDTMLQQVLERFGRIDVLVNNAGIISAGPWQTLTIDDFTLSMNNIYWATVNTTLAVLPHMAERKEGRIVNISSIGGMVSVPHLLPYASAKFAVEGFSEGLRAELAKDGIKVTTVVPGLMRTGSTVNTIMKGDAHKAEYSWFTLLDTLPLTSTSARHAAKQVVSATRHGSAMQIISLHALLLTQFHGSFPGLTSNILGIVNRFLPTGKGAASYSGRESETPLTRSFLTTLGRRAERLYNEKNE